MADLETQGTPVLIERKKKKKRKKYTRGYRDVQEIVWGGVKSSDRVVGAVASGFSTYRKQADKSARQAEPGEDHRAAGDGLLAPAGKHEGRDPRASDNEHQHGEIVEDPDQQEHEKE